MLGVIFCKAWEKITRASFFPRIAPKTITGHPLINFYSLLVKRVKKMQESAKNKKLIAQEN